MVPVAQVRSNQQSPGTHVTMPLAGLRDNNQLPYPGWPYICDWQKWPILDDKSIYGATTFALVVKYVRGLQAGVCFDVLCQVNLGSNPTADSLKCGNLFFQCC